MTKLYRLTNNAFQWLLDNVEDNLDWYRNPKADFASLLEKNITSENYREPTEIIIKNDIVLQPPDTDNPKKTHIADKQAIDFYHHLKGVTVRTATDHRMWAYINHFHLHEYGILRWPYSGRKDDLFAKHIRNHWLATEKQTRKIYESSISGRTWWLAHISIKASTASNGSFTPEEALQKFTEVPEYYHRSMQYEILRNPTILAECVRSLRLDADGINRKGYIEMAKELNREAGAKLLDSLPYHTIRNLVSNSADKMMRIESFVKVRSKLKGVKKYKVLSLGAGVQSTVMALMAETGWKGMQKPDIAIFADTKWEPPLVYEHLEWLKKQLSYKVVTVSAGDIRQNVLEGITPDGHNFLDIPVFLINTDGTKSVAARQCTNHYKITPIHKKLREILKLKPGRRAPKNVQVEMWMGISLDEAHRMKPSRDEWITNRYPLMEMELTRSDLQEWFHERYPDRPLPRSACVGCPFHTDTEWKWLKENDPASFKDAVFVDRAIRDIPKLRGSLRGEGYLHRDRKSLDSIDFTTNNGGGGDDTMMGECEGMCGV